jgi:hypothetical protein
MRNVVLTKLAIGTLGLIGGASAPTAFAVAHEEHHMECSDTAMNALKADIQSMNDGEAKTTAMKEMDMAQEMMAKKDMQGCMAHMHNAMEATEK